MPEDRKKRRTIEYIALADAEYLPPSGCSLYARAIQGGRVRELLIAPSSKGRYFVGASEPGGKPNLHFWTATDKAIYPDRLSEAVAKCAPLVDWSHALWIVRRCEPAAENPALANASPVTTN